MVVHETPTVAPIDIPADLTEPSEGFPVFQPQLPVFCPLLNETSRYQNGRLFISLDGSGAKSTGNLVDAVQTASDLYEVYCRGCQNQETELPHPDAMAVKTHGKFRSSKEFLPAFVLFESNSKTSPDLPSESADKFAHAREVLESEIKYVIYENPIAESIDQIIPPASGRSGFVTRLIRRVLHRS